MSDENELDVQEELEPQEEVEIQEEVQEEEKEKAPTFVEVGGKQYIVVKTGRAQAEQAIQITKWIARYGMPALQKAQEDRSQVTEVNGVGFIIDILENMTADALIDLFQAVIGCPKEDAEVYFDVALLIDTVILVYNEQPVIKKLLDRFFSTQTSA